MSKEPAESSSTLVQEELLFHRDERFPHTYKLRPAPTEAERCERTDLGNPKNPLGQLQGNDQARKRLCDIAFSALGRYNHGCDDVAFLFTGPKGASQEGDRPAVCGTAPASFHRDQPGHHEDGPRPVHRD